MRPFYLKYKRSIAREAFRSAIIISVITYVFFRAMFLDFNLGWKQEGFFFLKFFLAAAFGITAITMGILMLYVSLLKLKRSGRAIARQGD